MTTETSMYKTTRIIWYIFGAIEALLIFRFILRLLSANEGAAFTQFIYSGSQIFLIPFQFVFGTPSAGGSALELSTLLAIAVYYFIAWGIIKLLIMNRPISQNEAHVQLKDQDTA